MQSFNELLADYLLAYGRYVRENPHGDFDGRSILYEMQELSVIVKNENVQGLFDRFEELKENIALSTF